MSDNRWSYLNRAKKPESVEEVLQFMAECRLDYLRQYQLQVNSVLERNPDASAREIVESESFAMIAEGEEHEMAVHKAELARLKMLRKRELPQHERDDVPAKRKK